MSVRNWIVGIAFAIVCLAPAGVTGCTQLSLRDPAKITGALPEEANELRIIQAALVVKAANLTIGDQLDRGLITVLEAARLRVLTVKAEEALAAARQVLPLENGTTLERIAALDAIILNLLREQIIKSGA